MTTERHHAVSNDVLERYVAQLSGNVTRPDDANYDEARAVWNGMINRYPALIAHCGTTQDVIASVNFARDNGLPVAVRGGAHNVAGLATCDDGLVIDLTPMKQIDVDPVGRRARAGGGVTWGELDAATQEHGLATPGGVFSDTGIAGLTLGGGFGWLRNAFGLSCDNLIRAEVVTADGRLVHASPEENADLLWGLRGGGGNFGIVTTFEYQLHPVGPELYFVFAFHDGEGEKTREALEHYINCANDVPGEVSTLCACGIIPPVPEIFPTEIHERRFVLMGALYTGPVEEGKAVLAPFRNFNTPLVDFSGVTPYVDVQQVLDEDFPDGLRYYWKSLNLTRVDDAAIDRIAEHAARQPSILSTTDLWDIGPGVRQFSPEHSAFSGRQAQFLLNIEANWEDPDDDAANIRWVREFVDEMAEFSDGSRYLNFAGFQEEGDTMMQSSFGHQYERLTQLKTKYDPGNFFRLNQNIKPARPAAQMTHPG